MIRQQFTGLCENVECSFFHQICIVGERNLSGKLSHRFLLLLRPFNANDSVPMIPVIFYGYSFLFTFENDCLPVNA